MNDIITVVSIETNISTGYAMAESDAVAHQKIVFGVLNLYKVVFINSERARAKGFKTDNLSKRPSNLSKIFLQCELDTIISIFLFKNPPTRLLPGLKHCPIILTPRTHHPKSYDSSNHHKKYQGCRHRQLL